VVTVVPIDATRTGERWPAATAGPLATPARGELADEPEQLDLFADDEALS